MDNHNLPMYMYMHYMYMHRYYIDMYMYIARVKADSMAKANIIKYWLCCLPEYSC